MSNECIFVILLTIYGQIRQLTIIFFVLEGYNGNYILKLLFSLVNEGVNIFLKTFGEFLSPCLNVRGMFVIFPLFIKDMWFVSLVLISHA